MPIKYYQCEHCGSEQVVRIVDDLYKCNDCDEYFDSEDIQKEEKFRRKSKWSDAEDE